MPPNHSPPNSTVANLVDYTLDHRRASTSSSSSSSKKPPPSSSSSSSSDSSAGPHHLPTITPTSRWEAQEAMRSCALEILEQPLEMLRGGLLGDEQLIATSPNVAGSSVGKHLRHVLDHFRLLLDALEPGQMEVSTNNNSENDNDKTNKIHLSNHTGGSSVSTSPSPSHLPIVDYDRRSRSIPLETSSKQALAEFERTQERIASLLSSKDGSALDRPLIVRATTPVVQELYSTLGREVWFIALHSIHHFALARVILNELGVQGSISKDFGVAPSTLVFREWSKAQKEEEGEGGGEHGNGNWKGDNKGQERAKL